MDILNAEHQHLCQTVAHESEVTLHLVFPEEPLLKADVFILEHRAKNVDEAEVVALIKADILKVIVLWQHVPTTSLLEEIDMSYFISFEVDVLKVDHNLWLE